MVYGVGQSDNLIDFPHVAMPKYTNGSLSTRQYPCNYKYPDMTAYPEHIPPGAYDVQNGAYTSGYTKEPYVSDTQHKAVGEFSDIELFGIVGILLVISVGFLYQYSKNK